MTIEQDWERRRAQEEAVEDDTPRGHEPPDNYGEFWDAYAAEPEITDDDMLADACLRAFNLLEKDTQYTTLCELLQQFLERRKEQSDESE